MHTYIYTSTHTCIMYIHMYINAHRHTRTSIYVCMCVCVLMICLWIIKSHVFFPHGYVFIYRQVHIARRRALLISILLMIYSKQYLPGESVDTWLVKKYIYSLILTLIQWRAELGRVEGGGLAIREGYEILIQIDFMFQLCLHIRIFFLVIFLRTRLSIWVFEASSYHCTPLK